MRDCPWRWGFSPAVRVKPSRKHRPRPRRSRSFREQVVALTDRQAIVDTLQRYIRGIDRHDKDLVRSAFWPDARINLGAPSSREEYVDREEAALAAYAHHQHHITGQTIDIQGSTAHVESYVWFIAVPRDTRKDTPGPHATPGRPLVSEDTQLGSGRYIERWEKRDGEWKILVREYAHDVNTFGKTGRLLRQTAVPDSLGQAGLVVPCGRFRAAHAGAGRALTESNKEPHGATRPAAGGHESRRGAHITAAVARVLKLGMASPASGCGETTAPGVPAAGMRAFWQGRRLLFDVTASLPGARVNKKGRILVGVAGWAIPARDQAELSADRLALATLCGATTCEVEINSSFGRAHRRAPPTNVGRTPFRRSFRFSVQIPRRRSRMGLRSRSVGRGHRWDFLADRAGPGCCARGAAHPAAAFATGRFAANPIVLSPAACAGEVDSRAEPRHRTGWSSPGAEKLMPRIQSGSRCCGSAALVGCR